MIGLGLGIWLQSEVGSGTPAPPTLVTLTLSNDEVEEGSPPGTLIGVFIGKTPGSTITLTDDAGGRFAVSGNQLVTGATPTDYETAASHEIEWVETHPTATNSPNPGGAAITVLEAPAHSLAGQPIGLLLALTYAD